MARRSTKAGPARSRRRPDPSSSFHPGQLVYPLNTVIPSGGAGTAKLDCYAFDPTTGTEAESDEFDLTGAPTTMRFIKDTGETFVPNATYNTGTGLITFEVASGLPPGNYVLTSSTLDPVIRNRNGGWLGSAMATAVVT